MMMGGIKPRPPCEICRCTTLTNYEKSRIIFGIQNEYDLNSSSGSYCTTSYKNVFLFVFTFRRSSSHRKFFHLFQKWPFFQKNPEGWWGNQNPTKKIPKFK
ncbi:hypothetical protein RN001_007252 [Aquatica leii]|uniref:Uncharacterized protein n=1 Tax=Aquatica leii TaxID=1421715 RepID=A0AAN7S912_9COLE|nr:hypothetical protein RN001_007252 [Aquatica leii]